MKKYLLVLAFLTIFQLSYSQELNPRFRKGLSETEFLKAKEHYVELTKTTAYIEQRKAGFAFFRKVEKVDNLDALLTDESWAEWASENLKLTKFTTTEEAINMRKTLLELKKKFYEGENTEYFYLLQAATIEQMKAILEPEKNPIELLQD